AIIATRHCPLRCRLAARQQDRSAILGGSEADPCATQGASPRFRQPATLMADPRFRPATVLLFDPEPSMRQSIRSALLNIGFGAVIAAGDEADFVRKLEEESFDLVLAETASSKADTQHIIRDLRHSKVGQDPFVNVVLSIWNTGPEVVRDVINAGADDLILRPMSRAQIFARLRHLVNARKPFIVTADYIGPDRRASISKPSTAPTLIVPNSLRAKVEDMPELAATPEAIRLA